MDKQKKPNENTHDSYGEYFMNRTVADIMEEWSDWQGEWRPVQIKEATPMKNDTSSVKNYDLSRFLNAQRDDYAVALQEIRKGHKVNHWIWYIFPQIAGLGSSYYSTFYAISELDEAKAYLSEPTLRAHLLEISEALLTLQTCDPVAVMAGYTDAMKLRSSMTLFAAAEPSCAVFRQVLDKFFSGKPDDRTLSILGLDSLS